MKRRLVLVLVMIFLANLSVAALAFEIKPTGRIYANVNYNLSNFPMWDDRHGDNDFMEFALARAYLGVKATFSEQWFATVVGDIYRPTFSKTTPVYDDNGDLIDVEVKDKKGPYSYYVKYAYGQYTPFESFGFRIGCLPTPFIDRYEKAWGYRYVEKTPSDRVKWDSSADLGLAFMGKLPGGTGSYYAMVRNGEGYKTPESDTGKAAHLRLLLKPFQGSSATGNLQLTASYNYDLKTVDDPRLETQMVNILLSYKVMFGDNYGLNFGIGNDWLLTSTDEKGDGVIHEMTSAIAHAYGVIYFPHKIALFGRADWLDPDRKNDEDTHGYQDENLYLLGGVSIDPIKNIAFALDIKHTEYAAKVVNDKGGEVTKPAQTLLFLHSKFKF